MNASNVTTNMTANATTLNFAGIALQRLCPGNTHDAVYHATKNHLNPFQFLFTACIVVAVLSILPVLKNLALRLFDVNGDGEVNMDDVSYCCCGSKASQVAKNKATSAVAVVPSSAGEKGEKGDLEQGHEDLDALMEEAQGSNDTVLQGWLHIVYTLLFIYCAVAYMAVAGLANVSGGTMDTVFCKSGQIVLLPLFKAATASFWPAYMPMCQLAYWVMVASRAKTT